MSDCKWCSGDDEVCVNADCPLCTCWCPLGENQEICKYMEERGENDQKQYRTQRSCISQQGDSKETL